MSRVDHLIISSSIDYTTDHICIELNRRGCNYLRINRDQFMQYKVCFDVAEKVLYVNSNNHDYYIADDTLRSVYFRAPVFIRAHKNYTKEQQLHRSQWSSFMRNLSTFRNARWINKPNKTFMAENKIYQLDVALNQGMRIPDTVVTNYPYKINPNQLYIVKSLDTALFYEGEYEMFTYSTILKGSDLIDASLNDAPVIIQNCLTNKIDLRVTIIGNHIFTAAILLDGEGIEGDWRINKKSRLQYKEVSLPKEIESKIKHIMDELGLVFGGMDLAYADNEYFFIEVNPTGEWGWLAEQVGFPISKAIVDYMENENE